MTARRRDQPAPIRWGWVIAATLLAAGTVALLWFAAVPWGPLVCPAIDPPPRNCMESQRVGSALVATIAVLAVYAATVLFAVVGRPRWHALVVAGVVLLAVAPIVAYLAVAWMPGFPVGALGAPVTA